MRLNKLVVFQKSKSIIQYKNCKNIKKFVEKCKKKRQKDAKAIKNIKINKKKQDYLFFSLCKI